MAEEEIDMPALFYKFAVVPKEGGEAVMDRKVITMALKVTIFLYRRFHIFYENIWNIFIMKHIQAIFYNYTFLKQALGITEEFDTEAVLASMDDDGNGVIDLHEWTSCMTKPLRMAIYRSLANPDKLGGFKPLVDVAKVGNYDCQQFRK